MFDVVLNTPYKRRYHQHFTRLRNRKQRVVLNGQCPSRADVLAGVSQGSILGSLLFLIYVINLFNSLKSECKLFADDASLFSVVYDNNTLAIDLNEDFEKIGNWAFQWKINFNRNPNKQAQEIIFSRKKTASLHPVVHFDNRQLTQIHKHLGMMVLGFDSNLSYEHHKEAVARRCSVKKVFLKISQNSEKNTCARASFLIKLQARGQQLY